MNRLLPKKKTRKNSSPEKINYLERVRRKFAVLKMKHGESWTCPYCNQPTTITEPNLDNQLITTSISKGLIDINSLVGYRGILIACPNEKCKRLTFTVRLSKIYYDQYSRWRELETLHTWQVLPESNAKPQPSFIPKQIVDDYTEACLIKDLSPKASATLARRCLQGMIRDFWSISVKSKKLSDEINAIKNQVSSSDWGAIDAVRSVGNIGAHMSQKRQNC